MDDYIDRKYHVIFTKHFSLNAYFHQIIHQFEHVFVLCKISIFVNALIKSLKRDLLKIKQKHKIWKTENIVRELIITITKQGLCLRFLDQLSQIQIFSGSIDEIKEKIIRTVACQWGINLKNLDSRRTNKIIIRHYLTNYIFTRQTTTLEFYRFSFY